MMKRGFVRSSTWFVRLLIVVFLCMTAAGFTIVLAQQTRRPFTVADEIGLTFFGGPEGYSNPDKAVRFSPDGRYVAVYTSRGRLDLNRVEESLRFYRTEDIARFLRSDNRQLFSVWSVVLLRKRVGMDEAGIFGDLLWLGNSRGVVFRECAVDGNSYRLVLADLEKRALEELTPPSQNVGIFDAHDPRHYVYTAADTTGEFKRSDTEKKATLAVGTGRSLSELLFPEEHRWGHGYHLWAVIDGKRFEVKHQGVRFDFGLGDDLALSPDGLSIVGTLPVPDQISWAAQYPSYNAAYERQPKQYVRIFLQTGEVQPLVDAPTGSSLNWWGFGRPVWSSNGREILLTNTFLPSPDPTPSQPCVAMVDIVFHTLSCVERLIGFNADGSHGIVVGVGFAANNGRRVSVSSVQRPISGGGGSTRTSEYERMADATWQLMRQFNGTPETKQGSLEVTGKQGPNEPPKLVASENGKSRILWDPNPQLKSLELGQVRVFAWEDTKGRNWTGGLYLPSNHRVGHRYPLVIQGEGFFLNEFRPSGLTTTSYAASALAASGIAVLQVSGDTRYCSTVSPDEGPCAVSGYEIGVQKLISEGLVDPNKIGMIGFSRTCYYLMEMLTTSNIHLKVASITDGVMESYSQLLFSGSQDEAIPMVGAPPFGEGLQLWLKRDPEFNLDKVTAPLLVISLNPTYDLIFMWGPYAGLRALRKPVELMILSRDGEHVLTNPAARMAVQGASVDWFRFWLQDYEDPDPAKTEQYARWRELRKLQEANENKSTLRPVASN